MTERISRRQFLSRSAGLTAAGLLGLAVGRMAGSEFGLENLLRPDDQTLLARARQFHRPKHFGLYPDFLSHTDPWRYVEERKTDIGRLDLLGTFASIEDFTDASRIQTILHFLTDATTRGAVPVVSLGISTPRPNGYHPFDTHNVRRKLREPFQPSWMELQAKTVIVTLSRAGTPVILRLFYEMNVPSFSYGTGHGLSDEEQIRGYQECFRLFAGAVARVPNCQVQLSFSPFVGAPIEPYFPMEDAEALAASAGIDGYDLYPGSLHLFTPKYWLFGNQSPEEVLFSSLMELLEVSRGQIPFGLWEVGSATKRAWWLKHAALLTFALGGSFVMHFDINKSATESDWSISSEVAAMYRMLFVELNQNLPAA